MTAVAGKLKVDGARPHTFYPIDFAVVSVHIHCNPYNEMLKGVTKIDQKDRIPAPPYHTVLVMLCGTRRQISTVYS